MSLSTQAALKAYFQTGDKPTEAQFAELIDRVFSQRASSRFLLGYQSSTGVNFQGAHYIPFCGFRYKGSYIGETGPVIPGPASKIADFAISLDVLSTKENHNWYAVFAVADEGDSNAVFKIMPYLRVKSRSTNVITLGVMQEATPTPDDADYDWASEDNLVGSDILVIGENGYWSGRVTGATANDASSVTLTDGGTLAADDVLLPAPSGYDHYHYMGSFYQDSAEVRNIYDTGTVVKSKGTALTHSLGTGSVSSFTEVNLTGHICPLATAVSVENSSSFSTSDTGDFAEYLSPDSSNHTVSTWYIVKGFASTQTAFFTSENIPFFIPSKYFYSNAGGIVAQRSGGSFNPIGWLEP